MKIKELEEKYAHILHLDVDYAITCGEGWAGILENLFEKTKEIEIFSFCQIKEKFGGLRVYYNTYSKDGNEQLAEEQQEIINQLVMEAEREAWTVCEDCSSKNNVKTISWRGYYIRTLCEDCGKKEQGARSWWQ